MPCGTKAPSGGDPSVTAPVTGSDGHVSLPLLSSRGARQRRVPRLWPDGIAPSHTIRRRIVDIDVLEADRRRRVACRRPFGEPDHVPSALPRSRRERTEPGR